MARFKNQEWNLPVDKENRLLHWDALKTAVLMDIRDELQRLNALLHCGNFTGLPRVVQRIDKRLAKQAPLKAKRRA